MPSTVYFLLFAGFITVIIQSVTSKSSFEWDIERSSVNPLSYTVETNYLRRTTKSPVLPFYRSREQCPENEHFTKCDANCQVTCGNYKKPVICPRICIWGCVCNFGLVRGPDGKCITPQQCPAESNAQAQHGFPIPIPLICRSDELFDPCILGMNSCPDDCDNFNNKDPNCKRFCLLPSCVCKNGLVRSPDGKCVKPYECPQEKNFCPEGEEFSNCEAHCEGNCVKGEEDKNRCSSGGRLCVPGCTCKEGLVRGPDGTCIYRTECPTSPPEEPLIKVCPNNEVYAKCEAPCQRNCSNVDYSFPCPRICIPGCICNDPMIRGKYGKCVPEEECPKENASPNFYVTLNPPPYTDDDYHIPEAGTKLPPISKTENPQFEETEIPPIYQTNPSHKCPSRERWVPCGAHCQRDCNNKDDEDFDCRPVCIPGCICDEGLVRGQDGKCIEKNECPEKSDSERNQFPFPFPIICNKDEYLDSNPSTCPDDCYNYKNHNRQCKKAEKAKCICKKGLVRAPNGKCLKPSECPDETITCRNDEIFSKDRGNCERNCSNWAYDLVCPKKSVAGCVCRSGRIRGPDGKCIIWSQCPRSARGYPSATYTETPPPMEYTDAPYTETPPPMKYIDDEFQAEYNPCPDDKACRKMCRMIPEMKAGDCVGPDNLTCRCY